MSLITYLTRVHFAERVLEDALPEEMRRLSVTRPLVLIDRDGSAGEARARLLDALPADCDPLRFPDLPTDLLPGTADADLRALLDRAADACRAGGCDVILACGGATAMEAGRALAARLASRPTEGAPARPLLAVPTTAADIGLGPHAANLGPARARGTLPAAVLCDPSLTLAVEPSRTAAQGFDALIHCIESFLGTAFNPPADGIALEGVRRGFLHLERAVTDGADREARRELMAVALNAGLAAQKGLGGVEALSRAVEAECGLAGRHGMLHASMLPQVMAFNAPAVGDRYGRIAEAMGLEPGADVAAALAQLGSRLGLPERIGALGLRSASLRRAAERAAADPAAQTNPRHATPADYLALLERAL